MSIYVFCAFPNLSHSRTGFVIPSVRFSALPPVDGVSQNVSGEVANPAALRDVLLTFENEVYLIAKKINPNDFDVVIPSISIEADAPVAVVDKVVDKKGTRKQAEAYLQYLWSDDAQKLIAKHYFRPVSQAVLRENPFPKLTLLTIEQVAGDWASAQKKHFNDGGVFDQIYSP